MYNSPLYTRSGNPSFTGEHMKRLLIAGCFALAASLGAGQAVAVTYKATSDGYSYQFIPFATGATSQALYMFNANGTSAAGHSFSTLLDFNTLDSALASLTPGGYSATLNLHANCTPGAFGNVCPSQGAITGDIRTVTTPSSLFTTPSGGILHGSFTVNTDNGWISTDVTSLIAFWALAGSTGNGIALSAMAYPVVTSAGTVVAAMFDTLEFGDGSYAAFIDIQAVSAVPIPAALPLLAGGLGALGLIARRNRKKA